MRLLPIHGETPTQTEVRAHFAIQAATTYSSYASYETQLGLGTRPPVDFQSFGTPIFPSLDNDRLLGANTAEQLARMDYFGWQAMRAAELVRLDPIPLQRIDEPPGWLPDLPDENSIPFELSRFMGTQSQLLPFTGTGKPIIIGKPGQGTHSWYDVPNNWQSDNAVDIRLVERTPIFAVANAVVSPRLGFGPMSSDGGRFNGERLHLEYGVGQIAYYAHLDDIVVKPGERVKVGQVIGYSGSANGVPHLHFATKNGNPLNFIERGRRLPF